MMVLSRDEVEDELAGQERSMENHRKIVEFGEVTIEALKEKLKKWPKEKK